MINAKQIVAFLVLFALASGCGGNGNTREVNRYEFVEMEVVGNLEDESEFNHYYMGSLDGYQYLAVRKNRYKIPIDQLKLDCTFPLTQEKENWIPMRIHFSHALLEDGTQVIFK